MAKIRRELADLRAGDDPFHAAVAQLDALATEIAGAADTVMTAAEAIDDAATVIGKRTKDRTTKTHLKKITAGTGGLFEACAVQDITGQRIAKITRAIGAIDQGVCALARLAGTKGTGAGNGTGKAIDRVDGGIVLEGPQVDGPAVSQTEIDTLFD